MSYKSNAIINRVKQTIGWNPWVRSSKPLKQLTEHNIAGVKTAHFLRQWFKTKNWILLGIKQITSRQTQIWFITAMRVPRRIRNYEETIPFFEEDTSIAQEAQQTFFYKKRISVVLDQYKTRKTTVFSFTKSYRFSKTPKYFKKLNKSKKLVNKKSFLKLFLGSQKFNNLLKKKNITRKIKTERQFANAFPFRQATEAYFFFPTREWKKVVIRRFSLRNAKTPAVTSLYTKNKILKKPKKYKKTQYATNKTISYLKNFIISKHKKISYNFNKNAGGDYINKSYWNIKNKIYLKKRFMLKHNLVYARLRAKKFKMLNKKQTNLFFSKIFKNISTGLRKNKHLLKFMAKLIKSNRSYHLKNKIKTNKKKIKFRLKFLYLKKKICITHEKLYYAKKSKKRKKRSNQKKIIFFYKKFDEKIKNNQKKTSFRKKNSKIKKIMTNYLSARKKKFIKNKFSFYKLYLQNNSNKYKKYLPKKTTKFFLKEKKLKIYNKIKKVSRANSLIKNLKNIHVSIARAQAPNPQFDFYSHWKKIYFSKISQKRAIIKNFIKTWKRSRREKKKATILNRKSFAQYKLGKWQFYKDPLFHQLNEKIMFWGALRRNKFHRKYKQDKKQNLTAIVKIYEKKKLEKFRAKKWNNNKTFRVNYVLKKTLRMLFKRANPGVAAVKLLQPTGNLLSMKKFRLMASKITTLKMYKKQKLYRRFIRVLLIFFRYWHPQPLLEQIAFEMEKTKKHWPILKTMRTLILKLKPVHFYGYRIAVRGKINSSDRTRVFFIKHGHAVPISTFTNKMIYSMWHSLARTGVFSIKGWLYFPPTNNSVSRKNYNNI